MTTQLDHLPVGTRVMVDGSRETDKEEFEYGKDAQGKRGVCLETDHSYCAIGATYVQLDAGEKRVFWNKHLKVMNVGRNPV